MGGGRKGRGEMCKHLTSYLRSKLRSPQPPPHTSTNSQKGGDLYFISSFQRSYLRSRSSCFQLLPVARDASAVGVGDRHGDRRRARAEALSRLSNNERQVSQQTENCFKFQAMFQAKQQPASNRQQANGKYHDEQKQQRSAKKRRRL